MSNYHFVKNGECVSSLACRYGLHPRTIWNHPHNAGLKQQREAGTVLSEGDCIFIPDLELKEAEKPVDAAHCFVRRGLPERLRVRFLDFADRPRAGLRYTVFLDGNIIEGVTDAEGYLIIFINPTVQSGRLLLYEPADASQPEEYCLRLGSLAPVTTLAGVRNRLSNLGYPCRKENNYGSADDENENKNDPNDQIRACLIRFQSDHNLSVTGIADEVTRSKLQQLHGA